MPPTVDLLPAGHDCTATASIRPTCGSARTFRAGACTVRPTVSIYNLFNANPVQTYNNTYGPAWLAPTVILQARFVDIGVQVDF